MVTARAGASKRGGGGRVPGAAGTVPPARRPVPPATVTRLPGYLRSLGGLASEGVGTTSSDRLAELTGVTPAQLRKDLSFLGSHGRRGVGYDVLHLRRQIGTALGLTEQRQGVIVGIGNLGHALASYSGFVDRGFVFVGLLDADPAVVGTQVAGLTVQPLDRLGEVVRAGRVSIGVIATPGPAAQDVCDRLVAAGVTGVLSFAPRALQVPDGVDLRAVDLASELQILAFHAHRRADADDAAGPGTTGAPGRRRAAGTPSAAGR